jgi:hypothetical protein
MYWLLAPRPTRVKTKNMDIWDSYAVPIATKIRKNIIYDSYSNGTVNMFVISEINDRIFNGALCI